MKFFINFILYFLIRLSFSCLFCLNQIETVSVEVKFSAETVLKLLLLMISTLFLIDGMKCRMLNFFLFWCVPLIFAEFLNDLMKIKVFLGIVKELILPMTCELWLVFVNRIYEVTNCSISLCVRKLKSLAVIICLVSILKSWLNSLIPRDLSQLLIVLNDISLA